MPLGHRTSTGFAEAVSLTRAPPLVGWAALTVVRCTMARCQRAARSRPVVRGSVQTDHAITEPSTADAVEEREPEQLSFDF
jgi:hypothetical protein